MKIIVAVNNSDYIGKDGELMWRSSDDFKHFKAMTLNSSLIVGRTTFEKDLKGKKLVNRELFVVGTGYLSLFDAVKKAIETNKDIWVIGGETIYNQLLHLCDEIHISRINNNMIGDRKFLIPDTYRGRVFEYRFEENKSMG